MTKISIVQENSHVMIEIDGHSGYANEGEDIVCAAVSTLSICFMNMCIILEEKNQVKVCDIAIREGYFYIDVLDENHNTESALVMLKNGFYELSKEYPKNIFYCGEK